MDICPRHSVAATLHPDLVARHGIEPYPLAFQTSTLPSRSEINRPCSGMLQTREGQI